MGTAAGRTLHLSQGHIEAAGAPRLQGTSPPQDPALHVHAGLCVGPCGGHRGIAVFNEQGTPVLASTVTTSNTGVRFAEASLG